MLICIWSDVCHFPPYGVLPKEASGPSAPIGMKVLPWSCTYACGHSQLVLLHFVSDSGDKKIYANNNFTPFFPLGQVLFELTFHCAHICNPQTSNHRFPNTRGTYSYKQHCQGFLEAQSTPRYLDLCSMSERQRESKVLFGLGDSPGVSVQWWSKAL